MKRVQSACLEQTLHFMLKDGEETALAAKAVQEEVAHYKLQLQRSRTRYKLLSEELQPDGSVVVTIKKQYNSCPVGNYFD